MDSGGEASDHGMTNDGNPRASEGRQARPQARRPGRPRRGAAALPRGDVGGGTGPRGAAAVGDLRRARPVRDRRVRQRQVLQRGGLPLPEADPHRLPHQQHRPLHPAVPCFQRGRAVRGDRRRARCLPRRRRDQRRGGDRRRQQRAGQPPGRLQLFQASQADGTTIIYVGTAGHKMADHPDIFCQLKPGPRRRLLQRRDAPGDQARADRRRLHRRPHLQLRGTAEDRRRLPAGARADHRRARRRDPPGSAGLAASRGPASSTGEWASPSTPPAPTTRAARSRCAGSPEASASRGPGVHAARAEQRAGRLRHGPDPDVLPGLRQGRRPRRQGQVRAGLGR